MITDKENFILKVKKLTAGQAGEIWDIISGHSKQAPLVHGGRAVPFGGYPGCTCDDCKQARVPDYYAFDTKTYVTRGIGNIQSLPKEQQTIDKPKWVDGEGCQCEGCVHQRQRQQGKKLNREKFLSDWANSVARSGPHPVETCDCNICVRVKEASNVAKAIEAKRKVDAFGEYVVKNIRKANSWEAATKGYMVDSIMPHNGGARDKYFITFPSRVAGLNYSYRFAPKYGFLVYRATDPVSGQEVQLRFNMIVPARRMEEHGCARFTHRRDRYEALSSYVYGLGFPKPKFNPDL